MAPVLVTLNDLEGHSFSSAMRRTFVQHFTRSLLTACSRGLSATAGLLVKLTTITQHAEESLQTHHSSDTLPR